MQSNATELLDSTTVAAFFMRGSQLSNACCFKFSKDHSLSCKIWWKFKNSVILGRPVDCLWYFGGWRRKGCVYFRWDVRGTYILWTYDATLGGRRLYCCIHCANPEVSSFRSSKIRGATSMYWVLYLSFNQNIGSDINPRVRHKCRIGYRIIGLRQIQINARHNKGDTKTYSISFLLLSTWHF